MKEAALYQKLEGDRVHCETCAHGCVLKPGKHGICGVRENRDGTLVSLVYAKAVAVHADPVEKKPLFHFLPGSRTLSIATSGCNMHCTFCQNSDISQSPVDAGRLGGETVPPESVVRAALKAGCKSISYTYTEPAVYWDYAFDTARIARQNGLLNIFVTNGFWSEKSLKTMLPYMDGANVDLKAFQDKTYQKVCGARLEPVLECLRILAESEVWLEITTLLVPGLNDSENEIRQIAEFIRELDANIPWHISRFHPTYKMLDRPPTPVDTIRKAREIGIDAGLKYVYAGNVPGDDGESTFCPFCGKQLIARWGFTLEFNHVVQGRCPGCIDSIVGVWDKQV